MAKKATAVSADAFSDLDEIINKEFEGLTDLSKVDTTVNTWYDFGVYALNYISSKNLFQGVPAGRITSIKGRSGVGKSLLLAQIVKDPKVEKVIAIGSEGGGLSVELFNFVGASLEKIRLQSFNTFSSYRINKKNGDIEEVYDAKFPVKKDTEEYVYVEGATRFLKRFINAIEFKDIKSNIVILMDSLANFKSVRELNGGQDMGARAKDVNTFFGVFDNAFERTNIAFVFTNKVYTNLGNIYDPWKEAGGEGAIYNPSLSLFLSDTSSTEDKTDAEIKAEKERRKTALGSSLKSIKASVDKSRFGTEYRNITFLIDFAYGPVKLSGMFELCRDFGILEKSGNQYTMPGVIDKPFYKKNFIDVLSENEKELLVKIQARLEQAEADIKNKKSSIKASDMEDVSEETEYVVSETVKQMEKDM